MQIEIDGWKPPFATALVSVHHAALDDVGMTEHARRFVVIALAQQVAHVGAADALADEQERHRLFHGEVVTVGKILQQGEIPAPAAAETEIVTDDERLDTELADQQSPTNRSGGIDARSRVKCSTSSRSTPRAASR
jgi:hypothetical protein